MILCVDWLRWSDSFCVLTGMAGWVSSLETVWSTTRKCGSFCAPNCSSTATFLRSVLYRPTLFVAMFKPLHYCGAVLVSTPFTGYAGNDVDDSFHVHVFCVQFCLFGFVVGLLV